MPIEQHGNDDPVARKARARSGMNTIKYGAVGLPVALLLWIVGWGGLGLVVFILAVAGIGYGVWKVRAAVNR
ncbi:MAG: hypothetical protein L0H59_06390 [Tomitella sp.]|nr:hypothetical protein [Tomitella sp.]